jgi:hypothetical protein
MIHTDPIAHALADISKAKDFLIQCHADPTSLFALKEYIRQSLSIQVYEIVDFFNSQTVQFFSSEKKKHNVKLFMEIPRNQLAEVEEGNRRLSSPSQKDVDSFRVFFNQPCCKTLKCTTVIPISDALECFRNFIALSSAEQDFYIYGQLNAFSREPRSRAKVLSVVFDYKVNGAECCKEFYVFIHGMHSTKWLSLRQKNYRDKNFEVIDQRGGAHHVIPLEERIQLHTFIDNYLQKILLESPANGLMLLPCSFTFQKMFEDYKLCGGLREFSTIYKHFKDFWPGVRKVTQYSDYCNTCFIKRKLIKAATKEEDREEDEKDLEGHLLQAKVARQYYKLVNIGKAQLHDSEDFLCLSFDWAQNWDLPKYNKHPGELYFLSRQRVGIFGINDEKTDTQAFYCVPEKELLCYGKGANATLSYLYDYLNRIDPLPKKLVLYADNCAAQNKNNYLLWLLHWFCSTRNSLQEVEVNFLIAGHTKFSPDRHFGYAKKAYNSQDNIETYMDAVEVIENSSIYQKVIQTRDFHTNSQRVKIYDWKSYLSENYCKAPSRLKIFMTHFFKVKKNNPKIEYRMYNNTEPMFVNIVKGTSNMLVEPQAIALEDVPSHRIEELNKIEKFIDSKKLEAFWKSVK